MSICHAASFNQALLDARSEGTEALKILAEDHLPLVAAMVRRFPACGHEPEELYQQGCIGLMKALNRYDPDFGTTFSTYAATLILGEMRMLCRQDAPIHIPRGEREQRRRVRKAQNLLTISLGREPTIGELAALLRVEPAELTLLMENISVTSYDAPCRDTSMNPVNQISDHGEWLDRLMLRDLISQLAENDRQLVILRFRLGLTQSETAKRLGMTQVQVSRREAAIKSQLREEWAREAN